MENAHQLALNRDIPHLLTQCRGGHVMAPVILILAGRTIDIKCVLVNNTLLQSFCDIN